MLNVFCVNKEILSNIIINSVKYAIISAPFTYDRMGFNADFSKKINNIAKGKIAESMFYEVMNLNNIDIDYKSCETPFYKIDKRDFFFKNFECDLKNNFVSVPFEEIKDIGTLPALVPYDQWKKRGTCYFSRSKGVLFFFSFMEKVDRYEPLSIEFNQYQKNIIIEKYKIYNGKEQGECPYSEELFFEQFGNYKINSTIKNRILIAGYCDNDVMKNFVFLNAGHRVFCNGAYHSKYANMHLDIRNLRNVFE